MMIEPVRASRVGKRPAAARRGSLSAFGKLSGVSPVVRIFGILVVMFGFTGMQAKIALGDGLGDGLGNSLAVLDDPVVIKAREQPVEKFLGELFSQVGVPVIVDEAVRGAVNGDFREAANEVLDDVRKAFQLTYYYDGVSVYVYLMSDLSRDILYLDGPDSKQVMQNAQELGLMDENNHLSMSRMGLVATGTRRFHEHVRELSDAVESQSRHASEPETFRVFKLKYGWADDTSLVIGGQTIVVPGVATLLRGLVAPGTGGNTVVGKQRKARPATRPKLKGEGLQSVNTEGHATTSAEALELAETLMIESGGESGSPRIMADALNNAVVIRDRADRMEGYQRLIDSLDAEPLMVEIEATIIDMNTDRLKELGINWRLQSGDNSADLIGPDASGTATSVGEGGVVSLVLGNRNRFIARIRALEDQGAARIVSKPHVITLANVEAMLDSTSTFYVRVAGQEEVDLFDVSFGTTMRVTPHVFENTNRTQIKLLVNIEDGSTSDQRVDEIPVIERSTINTQALIAEGQSLLIGGLIREMNQSSVSKVPLLGDLPGIGSLFRSKARSSSQTERMFLITPRLTARAASGKRLDVPIVSGGESDIIASAPLRLEPARAGLNERDARFPVRKRLPGGSADVSLTTGEPARERFVLERAPVNDAQPSTAPGSGGWQSIVEVSESAISRPSGSDWRAVPGSDPQAW